MASAPDHAPSNEGHSNSSRHKSILRIEKDAIEWRAIREKLEIVRQGLDPGDDVFSLLRLSVNTEDSKKSLTEEDIVGQTSLIMLAANTLAFGLVELVRDPELQKSLRAEIHAALGTDRHNIAYDSMPLLNGFIKASTLSTQE
ncbi:hypothetical protein C8J57DRAFT_1226201 [Mycena rebaudengoi]|nr:hypothetical protein C8J57DRAFT_1226201 [Mycena rebaudengoi]